MSAARNDTKIVQAAGGIVYRPGDQGCGEPQILLVHRPRYDDWSLPKGKVDSGERLEDTARREVEEETGLRCTLGDEVGETRYRDARGRPKVVRYWLMVADDPSQPFAPNREVDEVRWCTPSQAVELLSYDHDRTLVTGLSKELLA